MALLFGMPQGISQDLEDALAAIQNWIGKQDSAGRWTTVPYAAENFYSTAGTWTVDSGDQRIFKYSVFQDIMFLQIFLFETSTSTGMGKDLRIRLPGNYRCYDSDYVGLVQWDEKTTPQGGTGYVLSDTGSNNNIIRLLRDILPVSTSWPSSLTNALTIRLNIVLPVYRADQV